ncbi:MAG: hypothetical protein ACRDKJ_08065, partial [Actinomycetota bacterium]
MHILRRLRDVYSNHYALMPPGGGHQPALVTGLVLLVAYVIAVDVGDSATGSPAWVPQVRLSCSALSESTVRTHVMRIYEKLKVRTRLDLL